MVKYFPVRAAQGPGAGRLAPVDFFAELDPADARLGGKARSLAELASRGLPTPAGFVIADGLLRALCPELPALDRVDEATLVALDRLRARIRREPWPPGFREELHDRLRALAAESRGESPSMARRGPSREGMGTLPGFPNQLFAVRSSFANEDRAGRLAAGVYESRVGVPLAEVERAVREVLVSAVQPGAVAYAVAHGDAPMGGPFSVLVHAYVAGTAEGSAALAGSPAGVPLLTCRRGVLTARAQAELMAALHALVAARGPVEVEWVCDAGRVIFLQARPYQPPPAPVPWPGFSELGVGEARDRWRWDEAHNPLPLSLAQAGLVELVDGACRIGVRQRVLHGYLFHARDERPLPMEIPCGEAEALFSSLRQTVEVRLAGLGDKPGLEAALELFVFAYEPIFGVLQPALRAAHARLREFVEAHAPTKLALLPLLRSGVPSLASERLARAERLAAADGGSASAHALTDYLARFGDEAATWDVAAPTYAEQPERLRMRLRESVPPAVDWRRANAELEDALDAGLRDEWRECLRIARAAVALGEADDWLYARVQAAVRRALLALGQWLCAGAVLSDVTDIFHLPLALVRDIGRGAPPVPGLPQLAAEGRRAWEAACRNPPPLGGTEPGPVVRGIGIGGRAIGRVVLHRPGMLGVQDATAVLVARTLLPTELPLLDAAALVIETGGPLDHVAAQARERNLPAVVGASGAQAALSEGDLALVDGDCGLVVKLA